MLQKPLNDFNAWVTNTHSHFERQFSSQISDLSLLTKAMGYTALNGGKRLRALLVYATGAMFNTDFPPLDRAAAAIECIHSYSLIHDDLPAMDNADLRRGKASSHRVFGEGMAILAGDALQTLAFEILSLDPAVKPRDDASSELPSSRAQARDPELSARERLAMIQVLAHASGALGMAGGQALDISPHILSEEEILHLYQLKTGALFKASIQLGLIASHQPRNLLDTYADAVSLAFQIQDDVLDMEGSAIGKSVNHDKSTTYARFLGIEKARQKVEELFAQAYQSLEAFDNAEILRTLTQFIQNRQN